MIFSNIVSNIRKCIVNIQNNYRPIAHHSMGKSSEASALIQKLSGIGKQYTLLGQYDKDECDYIKSVSGQYPVIRGFDVMNYSPRFVQYAGAPNSDEIDSYIRDSRDFGFILTASWHWSPSLPGVDQNNYYNAFYKMDLDPLGHLDALRADIDAIAEPLKKFKYAGIPIIWRPLHEVTQWGWFWWSKDANVFKTIYKLMYDRLTYFHGLDNLLWVFNPAHNYNFDDGSFYPGDDVVDIAAIDYPGDSSKFHGLTHVAPGKIIGIAEMSATDAQRHLDEFHNAPYAYMVGWPREQGFIRAGYDLTKRICSNYNVKMLPW